MWNWDAKPDEVIYMDFETQSLADLRKVGGRKYARDPSTRVSMAAFQHKERRTLWLPEGRTPSGITVPGWEVVTSAELPVWIRDSDLTFCAHNAGEFDYHVWQHSVGIERKWIDSAPFCRAAGLPGSLDLVSKSLFNEGKDNLGAKLIPVLCTARVARGEIAYPVATAAAWTLFASYCCKDVDLLSRVFPLVHKYGNPAKFRVNQVINDRGVPINSEFAMKLILLQEELKLKRGDEFSDITEIDNPRSGKDMIEWLTSLGVRVPMKANAKGILVPTLDRKELNKLFKEPDAFVESATEEDLSLALQALQLRIELNRATAGKAAAALREVDADSRARGQYIVNGAGTGRWSARGLQPQNFSRGSAGVNVAGLARLDVTLEEIEAEAARVSTPAQQVSASDVIASLLRPMVEHPSLAYGDWGQIEARMLAWLCEENDDLQEFAKWDADPYLPLASKVYGRPITKDDENERFLGKTAVLGCGYGMSGKKFNLYCQVYKIDLAAQRIDPNHVVKVYRDTHKKIAEGWKRVHAAAHAALDGKETTVCKCRFRTDGNDLVIDLPSGRPIIYRNARITMEVPAYVALFGLPPNKVPTIRYDHPHGYAGMLYGGRIMENIDQGTCSDLLANALIETERAGLVPIMHAHDEIGTEAADVRELARVMSTPPAWAEDFPLMVEAHRYRQYMKKPPKGAPSCKGLRGDVR